MIEKLGHDAEYAVEQFASAYRLTATHAAEILEDIVMNWENSHRPWHADPNWVIEPLTVDSLLADASDGMAEARAYDEEHAEEFSYEIARAREDGY